MKKRGIIQIKDGNDDSYSQLIWDSVMKQENN
jgi:hypothetical protein